MQGLVSDADAEALGLSKREPRPTPLLGRRSRPSYPAVGFMAARDKEPSWKKRTGRWMMTEETTDERSHREREERGNQEGMMVSLKRGPSGPSPHLDPLT